MDLLNLITIDEMSSLCEQEYGSPAVDRISSIAIVPPYEPLQDETVHLSDDESEGNVTHLPGRVLRLKA